MAGKRLTNSELQLQRLQEEEEARRAEVRATAASRMEFGASLVAGLTPLAFVLWLLGAGLATWLARGKDPLVLRRARTGGRGGTRG